MKKNVQAFTLIELSIVVVIIGLIVAGVVAGQSLVQQAKLRTIISNVEKYKVAINTFKLSYGKLPGDINNAQSYWSGCNNVGSNNCNGDGDGFIDSDSFHSERLSTWVHLSLANLINGSFVQLDNLAVEGQNFPSDSIGVYGILSGTGLSAWGWPRNRLTVAKINDGTSTFWSRSVVTSNEAYSLDKKLDDGIAFSGSFVGQDGSDAALQTCSDRYNQSSPNDYNLQSTVVSCRLYIDF